MKDAEYRALVEAGPTTVMVSKEDMLKLLDWVEFGKQAEGTLRAVRIRLMTGDLSDAKAHIQRRLDKVPQQ